MMVKFSKYKGIIIGLILGIIILMIKDYYESETYYSNRIEFISNHIGEFNKELSYNGENCYYVMYIEDDYYEEVTIRSYDGDFCVIFWADRNNDTFVQNFKWRFIADTKFYLDDESELDCKIVDKLENL